MKKRRWRAPYLVPVFFLTSSQPLRRDVAFGPGVALDRPEGQRQYMDVSLGGEDPQDEGAVRAGGIIRRTTEGGTR